MLYAIVAAARSWQGRKWIAPSTTSIPAATAQRVHWRRDAGRARHMRGSGSTRPFNCFSYRNHIAAFRTGASEFGCDGHRALLARVVMSRARRARAASALCLKHHDLSITINNEGVKCLTKYISCGFIGHNHA
jgi:hypothetical protein